MTSYAQAAAKREFDRQGYRCVTAREFLGWWEMALHAYGPVNGSLFCQDCPLETAGQRQASGVCIRVKQVRVKVSVAA